MSVTQNILRELEQVAPRLRRARQKKDMTLDELSRATGISRSTLSRLESGQRKPSLELLLPVIAALSVSLDEIVRSPKTEDSRISPKRAEGRVLTPLSQHPGELQAYKITIPATERVVELHTHTGHEWLYVLSGRLRVVLGEHDLVLNEGEAAEFDTLNPHWFGSAGSGAVEILSMFGKQGQRMHLRAKSAQKARA
ncbi:transcriptional regulator, XRE family with cupin sensor [Agreia bicolorata]|uniref:Transcriptional regulator, XRE family with cupin sensor n=1 Tax=Agreia bicolorata TaxID=110935 RepID=A0A1T4Y993_9MICO|nr:XRE family transcriptional regulator [Agreia bicolorata]KJC64833.1 XRE family transcriptional regulator [Agreia bicolorata]SKA98078.1 transcriptional regulator, XRE family with cupin sensor [Agreia bicolorata]